MLVAKNKELRIGPFTGRLGAMLEEVKAGVSYFSPSAIGGWKSPVMLQRYGKVRSKTLHGQMAKLNVCTVPPAEAEVSP